MKRHKAYLDTLKIAGVNTKKVLRYGHIISAAMTVCYVVGASNNANARDFLFYQEKLMADIVEQHSGVWAPPSAVSLDIIDQRSAEEAPKIAKLPEDQWELAIRKIVQDFIRMHFDDSKPPKGTQAEMVRFTYFHLASVRYHNDLITMVTKIDTDQYLVQQKSKELTVRKAHPNWTDDRIAEAANIPAPLWQKIKIAHPKWSDAQVDVEFDRIYPKQQQEELDQADESEQLFIKEFSPN